MGALDLPRTRMIDAEVERFPDELHLVKLNGRNWRVVADYRYRSPALGTITVPAGFETDLASVPWWARCWIAAAGDLAKPAVVHDWLYDARTSERWMSRTTADRAFREAMRVRGVSRFLRTVIYLAVRLGGRRSFRRPRGPRGSPRRG